MIVKKDIMLENKHYNAWLQITAIGFPFISFIQNANIPFLT